MQATVGTGHQRQQPLRDLPVAADPAPAARRVGGVARRVVLEQLHVAQQAGARVAAFEQVVAEDPVLGEPPVHRLFEGLDLVDALADERPLAEQVLVDVRRGARVGVDAQLARAQPRVARAVGAREAGCHPRLQDAVTLDNASTVGVVARAIEGVRHGADELAGRVARQFGVAVQGDHVPHIGQGARCRR